MSHHCGIRTEPADNQQIALIVIIVIKNFSTSRIFLKVFFMHKIDMHFGPGHHRIDCLLLLLSCLLKNLLKGQNVCNSTPMQWRNVVIVETPEIYIFKYRGHLLSNQLDVKSLTVFPKQHYNSTFRGENLIGNTSLNGAL